MFDFITVMLKKMRLEFMICYDSKLLSDIIFSQNYILNIPFFLTTHTFRIYFGYKAEWAITVCKKKVCLFTFAIIHIN